MIHVLASLLLFGIPSLLVGVAIQIVSRRSRLLVPSAWFAVIYLCWLLLLVVQGLWDFDWSEMRINVFFALLLVRLLLSLPPTVVGYFLARHFLERRNRV